MKKVLLFILMFVFGIIFLKCNVFAHIETLNIEYDNCMINNDLRWYSLKSDSIETDGIKHKHIDENTLELRYYVAIYPYLYSYEGVTDELINEVVQAFVASMRKWEDVFFYSYDSSGNIKKNKVIEIKEGTYDNYNLLITFDYQNHLYIAGTNELEGDEGIVAAENSLGENIKHNNRCGIVIDLFDFIVSPDNTIEEIMENKEIVGAHEMGHILGLGDLRRENCGYNVTSHSHNETIMGYGTNNHVEDITYQDLAGVAITRGFHTDNDHQWLNMGLQHDGTYKFVCSICNGIIYDAQYYNYQFHEYGSCNNNHTLSSNNMMAVGCNGNKDYIKCKYCRYVAPIEDMVTQNYTYQTYNSNYHKKINNVTGLNYTILEEHNTTSDNTNTYTYKDKTGHDIKCKCGYVIGTEYHAVTQEDCNDGNNRVTCVRCGIVLNMRDSIFIIGPMNITKYSINGSYILPNGIIILVNNDIQSYLNNTLIFYDKNNLPQIS